MQLRLGFETSVLLSHHAGLVDVASAIFGDGKSKKKVTAENDVTAGVASYDVAISNMNNLLKFG